jgi:hypothetical protein
MDVPALGVRVGIFISAAALMMAGVAIPADADSSNQPAVQAQQERLQHDVELFLSSAIARSHHDEALDRWNSAVCPLVAGLDKEQGEFILARLSQIVKAAGAPLGGEKCNANFFIVFSKTPEPGLKRLENHHDAKAFDHETETQLRQFVDTPRPVRIWYNVGKTSVQGTLLVAAILDPNSGAARHFPAPQELDPVYNRVSPQFSSRLNATPVARDIVSVIVVVDTTQVRRLNFGQIGDYIGMIGLAPIDLDKDLGDAPTILNMFKDSDESRAEMTVWDKALLHALYSTTPNSKAQLSEIQTAVMSDIAANGQN